MSAAPRSREFVAGSCRNNRQHPNAAQPSARPVVDGDAEGSEVVGGGHVGGPDAEYVQHCSMSGRVSS